MKISSVTNNFKIQGNSKNSKLKQNSTISNSIQNKAELSSSEVLGSYNKALTNLNFNGNDKITDDFPSEITEEATKEYLRKCANEISGYIEKVLKVDDYVDSVDATNMQKFNKLNIEISIDSEKLAKEKATAKIRKLCGEDTVNSLNPALESKDLDVLVAQVDIVERFRTLTPMFDDDNTPEETAYSLLDIVTSPDKKETLQAIDFAKFLLDKGEVRKGRDLLSAINKMDFSEEYATKKEFLEYLVEHDIKNYQLTSTIEQITTKDKGLNTKQMALIRNLIDKGYDLSNFEAYIDITGMFQYGNEKERKQNLIKALALVEEGADFNKIRLACNPKSKFY